MTRSEYIKLGIALGLNVSETMQMAPGLVFDMRELENRKGERPDGC